MKIDEMKNRISLELKNPITQQGFEIICKKLSELEKENAELKAELKIQKNNTHTVAHLNDCILGIQDNRIVDLEKENADLKEEIDEIAFVRGELEQENESLENVKNIYIEDLLKAKEIIKEFMRISIASVEEYEPEFTELIGKAEQFVSEVDK